MVGGGGGGEPGGEGGAEFGGDAKSGDGFGGGDGLVEGGGGGERDGGGRWRRRSGVDGSDAEFAVFDSEDDGAGEARSGGFGKRGGPDRMVFGEAEAAGGLVEGFGFLAEVGFGGGSEA